MPVIVGGPLTAEQYFRAMDARLTSLDDFATIGPLAGIARRAAVTLAPLADVAPVAPIPVWVQENQWVTGCPDCRQRAPLWFVWQGDPVFLCVVCWNAAVEGRWRPLQLPPERDAIDQALRRRHSPATRNWLPDESVADLDRESVQTDGRRVIVRPSELFTRVFGERGAQP